MDLVGKKMTVAVRAVRIVCAVSAVVLIAAGPLQADQSTEHYKMLSIVEYSGKGQFRSEVDTLLTVKKEMLADDVVQFDIASEDFDLWSGRQSSSDWSSARHLSFIVNRKTGYLSGTNKDLELFERINNQCISSLDRLNEDNIGKTWKQTFDLGFLDPRLPQELRFTLTAIKLEGDQWDQWGGLTAVRALSEPFKFNAVTEEGQTGTIKSRINAVYLFGRGVEDVHMTMVVFEADTKMNGFKEQLRHEIATYRTDSQGVPLILDSLGKKFEKLVSKVGLSKKAIKVSEQVPLPRWAQSEGLVTAQVANICAATACEGALNPVAAVLIPSIQTIGLQSTGAITSIGSVGTVSGALTASVPALSGMQIAMAPSLIGLNWTTAGAVAGGTVAIAAGGSSGGSSSRSSQ